MSPSARAGEADGAGPGSGLTWEDVVAIGLGLPGVALGSAYGTPALRIGLPKGKLVARLREDLTSVAVPCAPEEKLPLLAAHAGPLFTTPHYDRSAYVCVALAAAGPALVAELLEDAWALRAPARAVAAWLEARG